MYNPELETVLERMELVSVLEKYYGKIVYWHNDIFKVFGTGWLVSLEAAREIKKMSRRRDG